MKSHPLIKWLILLGFLATATGCVITPVATEMTPLVSGPVGRPSSKTLKIMPLQEGDTWRNSLAKWNIQADSFQEALVATLKQTGRFKEVFTSQEGDYLLRPNLISIDVSHGIPTSMHLFVHYSLVDAGSGKEIWQGNLYSQGTSKSGPSRIGGAYGEAVKNNLSQLAQRLSELKF
jgi:hypothetical protein